MQFLSDLVYDIGYAIKGNAIQKSQQLYAWLWKLYVEVPFVRTHQWLLSEHASSSKRLYQYIVTQEMQVQRTGENQHDTVMLREHDVLDSIHEIKETQNHRALTAYSESTLTFVRIEKNQLRYLSKKENTLVVSCHCGRKTFQHISDASFHQFEFITQPMRILIYLILLLYSLGQVPLPDYHLVMTTTILITLPHVPKLVAVFLLNHNYHQWFRMVSPTIFHNSFSD